MKGKKAMKGKAPKGGMMGMSMDKDMKKMPHMMPDMPMKKMPKH